MMVSKACIFTDSSVEFPYPEFPGREFVKIIPAKPVYQQNMIRDDVADTCHHNIKTQTNIHSPSIKTFQQTLENHCLFHSDVFVILPSSCVNKAVENARQASEKLGNSSNIHIIDSKTIATGLGFLVQSAAEAVLSGVLPKEIKRILNGSTSNIYTVFCAHNFEYLLNSRQINPAQALIGEMLGCFPILILEDGHFKPIHKVMTPRHKVDFFHEFIAEIGKLKHIALHRGKSSPENDGRLLRERISNNFPHIPITEHKLAPSLTSLLGDDSLGIVAIEE